jgi:large subunit ribosomal protein L21
VVGHGLGKKVLVFKKKRKKGYQIKKGHRQGYTELHIRDIAA